MRRSKWIWAGGLSLCVILSGCGLGKQEEIASKFVDARSFTRTLEFSENAVKTEFFTDASRECGILSKVGIAYRDPATGTLLTKWESQETDEETDGFYKCELEMEYPEDQEVEKVFVYMTLEKSDQEVWEPRVVFEEVWTPEGELIGDTIESSE